ncbi:hypothetical protein F5882DRAFT_305779, partial [Hyaloscypha sp. PMI_1271]
FYKVKDLVYYRVTFILALVLTNNVFENKLTSLSNIYSLVILPNTNYIYL